MNKRLPYLLVLCLAVLCIVSASVPVALPQTGGTPGTILQAWDIDAAKNIVTLHLVNTTGKDITAYNIKIKETYGTSVNEHEYSTDTVELMLNIQDLAGTPRGEQLRQMYGNGTFQAGRTRDEVLHVQPGLTNFEATLDTAIYADKTAETTNQEALDRALTARKGFAYTIQMTNEIIKKALANAQDSTPQETAAKEIEQLRRTWEAHRHQDNLNAGALQAVLNDLKNAPSQNTAAFLNDYVAKKDQRASVLLEHAAPKVGGVQ
jgi:hypothetical protein